MAIIPPLHGYDRDDDGRRWVLIPLGIAAPVVANLLFAFTLGQFGIYLIIPVAFLNIIGILLIVLGMPRVRAPTCRVALTQHGIANLKSGSAQHCPWNELATVHMAQDSLNFVHVSGETMIVATKNLFPEARVILHVVKRYRPDLAAQLQ